MGEKQQEPMNLIYHWSCEDSIVNDEWVDRIQGCAWHHDTSTPLNRDSDNGIIIGKNAAIFTMNGLTDDFNIGQYFTIEVSFDKTGTYTNTVIIMDFGSVATANNAFAFYYGYEFKHNLKTQGNNSTYNGNFGNYRVTVGKHVLTYGVEPSDDEHDIRYIEENGVKHYCSVVTPHLVYTADTWHRNTFFMGKSNSGNSADTCTVYDIKIRSTLTL